MAEFGEERREPVSIDQVPESLIQAILAAEDDRFYSHPGVDFMGVLRAAAANLRSGSHDQGASTMHDRCTAMKDQILAEHTPEPLDDDTAREVDKIVAAARQHLS